MNLKKISKVAYWRLPNIDEIFNLPHCSGDTADDALNGLTLTLLRTHPAVSE